MLGEQNGHVLTVDRVRISEQISDNTSYFIYSDQNETRFWQHTGRCLWINDYEERSNIFFDWKMRLLATAFLHPVTKLFYESAEARDAAVAVQREIMQILVEGHNYSLPKSNLK